jgi:hypothetical protein
MRAFKPIPVDSIHLGISLIQDAKAVTFDFTDKNKSNRPWVASIESICPKYGFKREFANKSYGAKVYGGKAQMISFELQRGKVYEFKNFLLLYIRPELTSGFFGVDGHGKIVELSKDQVREYLNMKVKK